MSENHKDLQRIASRLDAVISILFESAGRKEKFSLKERIKILDSCGLSPSEIAEVLGTTSNYVNVQLSLMRKTAKRHSRRGE